MGSRRNERVTSITTRHHQRCTGERNVGAIEPEAGNASERNAWIS